MNFFVRLYENLEEEEKENFKYWYTQRNNTQKSYQIQAQFFNNLLNKDEIIIDYGSGLGMVKNYFSNFNYIDFEPYPQERENPNFTSSENLLNAYKNKASGVVCNLVLNVIDNIEDRKNAVENILKLLKIGGVAFIVTRTPQQVEGAKTKEKYGDGYKIKSKDGYTFQKGFTNNELKAYVSSVLPNVQGKFEIDRGVGVSGNASVKVTRKK
jgi:hypothetical protein